VGCPTTTCPPKVTPHGEERALRASPDDALHRRQNREAPSLPSINQVWQSRALIGRTRPAMKSLMLADDESAALVRFNVFGKY
jgi:hypothetical protein